MSKRKIDISRHIFSELIAKLEVGILIHLRYTYPVIDAVGYLCVDGEPSLVFMQISLSKYSQHDTKLKDLLVKPAPEDASKCINDVCMQSIIQEPTQKQKRSASQT